MKTVEMSDYNRAAKVYWAVMVAAGAIAAAWAIQQCLAFSVAQWAEFSVLLSLVILAGASPIRIPNTSAVFTAGDTFTFLSVLFLGVPAAILVGIVDSFVGTRRASKRGASLIGAPAMMAVSVFVAGRAFYLVLERYAHISQNPLGTTRLALGHLLAALATMAMLHYLANGFTVSTIYALRNRQPILQFWRDGYLWTWWSFLAAAIATAVVYTAISRVDLPFVVLSLPIIAATYWTYRVYFERVSAKTREAEEMSRLHLATVEALATAIDAKDQTTHCHVRRVQIYAVGMGELLGLSRAELAALNAGALLHDIGKLAVPDHILNKPGKLTASEFERTKVHTTIGAEILGRVDFPYPVLPIIRHHHEQWDGRGYPDALKGEQIPITARIISVVDCFDAAREERPFRAGMTREAAIEMLRSRSRTSFDPEVVDLFIQHLPRFEAEIVARGLEEQRPATAATGASGASNAEIAHTQDHDSDAAYDQIRNAHREVYALYEIARTFGSSLDVENTISILIDKVTHIVPFDTCAVYLYDEVKGYAHAAHVVGMNAEMVRARCIAPGEGVTGFALANRRPVDHLHPSIEFGGVELAPDMKYRSMASLPLFKDDLLLGALSVYSMDLGAYTPDQIRLLETVTRLASDALANAVQHAQAESNALTDQLTGLPNARCLLARFEEEVARSRRTAKPFQVVMLDLDNFKLVNDTFGHKIGDKMLREVANIVHAQLREYDFLARYAGDEFVAIVQDLSRPQVEELCERIEEAVGLFSLHIRGDLRTKVGISAGSAVYGIDGETLDQLLISADQAMYCVKSAHKRDAHLAIDVDRAPALELGNPANEMGADVLVTNSIN
jgi:diguanylate cyclase (GGDEF)-like protein/putative nucleotidyltransferase with HDIG domain